MEVTFSINLWWVIGPLAAIVTIFLALKVHNDLENRAYDRFYNTYLHANNSGAWFRLDDFHRRTDILLKHDKARQELMLRMPHTCANLDIVDLAGALRTPRAREEDLRYYVDQLGPETFMVLANASGNLDAIAETLNLAPDEPGEPEQPGEDDLWTPDEQEEGEPVPPDLPPGASTLRRIRRIAI